MRLAAAFILALAASLPGGTPAAAATSPSPVVADVEGQPIGVDQIHDFYCHDRDFPRVHCFRTSGGLARALAAPRLAPASSQLAASPAAGTGDYVIIYAGQYLSGSYMVVSQDYDTLVIVGWNDHIRSFTALNGASGAFYTDWFGGGYRLAFCCNASTRYLSSTFDQTITSVYRT